MLDHMVVLFLVFWGTNILFPYWRLYQSTFPPTVYKASLFSMSSPTFVICRSFDDSHSDNCEVIPHFDLHFSNNWWYWESFHVPFNHLYFFFGKMSIQILCPLSDLRCEFVCLFVLQVVGFGVFFMCGVWAVCSGY